MAVNPNCAIIAVVGGKGGVGKSVFAANLAIAAQIELRSSTLLIDADSESCGDQNVITGLKTPKTLSEMTSFTGSVNQQSIPGLVSRHPQAGFSFLGAVKSPTEKLSINTSLVGKAIDALSNNFKYIIVDLGCNLGDLQMEFLERTDLTILVTTNEVLAVTQSIKMLNKMMGALIPGDTIKVVVNRANNQGLSPQAIGQNQKEEVIGVVPQDDNTAGACLNRSTPIVIAAPKTPIAAAHHEVVRKLTGGILQKAKSLKKPQKLKRDNSTPASGGANKSSANILAPKKEIDGRTQLKIVTHKLLIKAMNLKNDDITKAKNDPSVEEKLRNDVRVQISKIVDQESPGMQASERRQIIQEILDEALGLGPLEDLLADDGVSEIMVNGHEKIFFEKSGRLNLSKITFTSNVQLRNVIERIVTPLGRRIDEKTPYVDARLMDGSRVNAIIEPLSIDGPALTIRKFRKDSFGVDEYLKYNSASPQMMEFLKICCSNGLNVVISGGTGSGKTTLLNCMSSFIPSSERIITVEDAAELQLKQEHVVRLETRPANMEGTGAVTIRDLIKNSLRMRPDRIVVGECRDGAALDMLAAMNTGHDGSMTTVHSNNARECTARLVNLCLQAGVGLGVDSIKENIAGAVDLIVQISRLSDGSRKLLSITEVQGMQGETITLQEVFRFVEKGFDKNRKIVGEFQATGLIPKFIEKFERKGIIIPKSLFSNEKVAPTQPAKKRTGPSVPRRPQQTANKPQAGKPQQPLKKAGGS